MLHFEYYKANGIPKRANRYFEYNILNIKESVHWVTQKPPAGSVQYNKTAICGG
jgi:hypothetical protein